jgi:hypothetical protein
VPKVQKQRPVAVFVISTKTKGRKKRTTETLFALLLGIDIHNNKENKVSCWLVFYYPYISPKIIGTATA